MDQEDQENPEIEWQEKCITYSRIIHLPEDLEKKNEYVTDR